MVGVGLSGIDIEVTEDTGADAYIGGRSEVGVGDDWEGGGDDKEPVLSEQNVSNYFKSEIKRCLHIYAANTLRNRLVASRAF